MLESLILTVVGCAAGVYLLRGGWRALRHLFGSGKAGCGGCCSGAVDSEQQRTTSISKPRSPATATRRRQ